ncbi:QsdR family transcriptional regulator [Actinoplanes philippinensis]|uniref:QsdR family transcriptional regulator n=1 Tax=Actinoplanes philippinensis TaxID=35752 RepID=UPI0033F5282F
MPARRVIDPDVMLRGAAMHYFRHSTIDMDLLATEMAISRATLYRMAGSRDALLGEVFWALGRIFLAEASAGAIGTGADRVLHVSRLFAEMVTGAQQLRNFVAEEPQTAARVLLTTGSDVHHRAVGAQLEIFGQSGIGGDPADLRQRAFLYVRLMESVVYSPVLGVPEMDFDLAEPALRALLPR